MITTDIQPEISIQSSLDSRWRGRGCGNTYWDYSSIKDSSSNLGDYKNEVIPFFGLVSKEVTTNIKCNYYGDNLDLNLDIPLPIKNWVGGNTKEEIAEKSKEVQDKISIYLNSKVEYALPDNVVRRWSGNWVYKDTVYHFMEGSGCNDHGTRTWINGVNLKYLVSRFYLSDISGPGMIPLVCLVTKPEYADYIKMSIILNKKVDPRVFQIWVHPSFDIPRSKYKGIRPYIRKQFLIPFYDAGVKVIETSDFSSLFKNYTPPKLNSIGEYKKWLNDCSIESINNIKSKINGN